MPNIYYPWRSNAKIFNWILNFYNISTTDNNYYLRDGLTTLIYDEKNKNSFLHKIYHLDMSYFTKFTYIDVTIISTKDFYQLLIAISYNSLLNIK